MAALQEPKKPLASYLLYATVTGEAVRKELGTKELGAVAKTQTERWKVLPAAEKQKYEKQAAAAKEQYQKDLEAFKEAGGEVGAARKEKKAAKNKKAEKKCKKGSRERQAEKARWGSVFMFYSQEP